MESRFVTVATCNLNQWALDFDGNCARVLESCRQAKAAGASYRLGPELELSFYEIDTIDHCWESLATLFRQGATDDLLCDFGMPLLWKGTRYNCRILAWNRKILLIRPKSALADDGNYRESRYFTPYRGGVGKTHDMVLPRVFATEFGQTEAPMGLSYLRTAGGLAIGCESCEELWTPVATHIGLALQGVELIGNGSGSYHSLRKLNQRLELIVAATRKCGGIYLYANQRGCDGGRLYFDGGALIACNGRILAQASQFGLQDVEVVTATVNVDEVRSYRASIPSFGMQTSSAPTYDPVDELSLDLWAPVTTLLPSLAIEPRTHLPEEECALGPACWLWDYLRRSGASGFMLPLSGGADSTAVATIVGAMCVLVTRHAQAYPQSAVADDCRRLCRQTGDWVPDRPQDLASHVMHTVFLGTENSSQLTTNRAKRVGQAIGSYHLTLVIDAMVTAVMQVFTAAFSKTPRFSVHGGTMTEDLALQNIQARLRMVTTYLLAQLVPWIRGRSGFLLVLGSANVDEGLRGYLTKYDCSSADLNPIGAISKGDLKKLLVWASETYGWDVLAEVAGAPPTAELRPNAANVELEHSQLDEEEMGMSYEELGIYGKLRKVARCGPVSMFRELCLLWSHLTPKVVAEKVKHFWIHYSRNRHKMCTITPSYHAENYSPDDNRFDLRPFLYPTRWLRQFRVIDDLAGKTSTKQMMDNLEDTKGTQQATNGEITPLETRGKKQTDAMPDDGLKYCLQFADVERAAKRIADKAHRTPVLTSASLNTMAGNRNVFFKVEAMQKTGSFKFRGALNAVRTVLESREGQNGQSLTVLTHSSGNHAQALALAARLASTPSCPVAATIVMPENTPLVKKNAVADFGANIVMSESTNQARRETTERIQKETGATFIHPSEDPRVIAGQGTVCLEMIQQVKELTKNASQPLDAVIIPVGGGGLASGNLVTLRALLGKKVKVILAEPAELDDAKRSFEAGQLLGHATDNPLNSVADGLKTTLGPHTWPIVRDLADAILTVSEKDILSSTKLVWERLKVVIEPSAGVGVAVLLSEEFQTKYADCKNIGVVLCGGNVDVVKIASKMQEYGV